MSGDAKAVHRELSAALRDADRATGAVTTAYQGVGEALPSDRADLRRRADDAAVVQGREAEAAWDRAIKAAERLAQAARDAAIPEPPSRREYAQVADELRMLLNGKTKEQVVDIATRPRYVGLMARDFGRAWCEANLDDDLAKLTHEAIVAKATNGASTKAVTAAKRAMAARKAADWNRLRAAGAKQ